MYSTWKLIYQMLFFNEEEEGSTKLALSNTVIRVNSINVINFCNMIYLMIRCITLTKWKSDEPGFEKHNIRDNAVSALFEMFCLIKFEERRTRMRLSDEFFSIFANVINIICSLIYKKPHAGLLKCANIQQGYQM